MKEGLRFIDFFSGIGGFRLGMEMAGHECVGHCEIDKFADKSYRTMHDVKENEWYANDITRVIPDELPDADCYCGGFPCQAFSIAGNRGGFEDTRGTLFFEVMRIARVRKPKYLFLENVKGLLSHDGGRTFGTIIRTLWESGYDAEWQICNSKNFGVPQNRERVFVVGYLRGERGREVFPIYGESRDVNSQHKQQGNQKACRLNKPYRADGFTPANEFGLYGIGSNDFGALTARYHKGLSAHGDNVVLVENEIKQLNNPVHSNDRVYAEEGVSPCLNTMQGGNRQPFVRIIDDQGRKKDSYKQSDSCPTLRAQSHGNEPKVLIKEATKKGYAEAGVGDSINLALPDSETRRGRVGKGVANTLDTSCNQGTIDGVRIRRLTPRECFRLQGFPDDYFDRAKEVNSDSQLYKQAGNSVTVNVINAIAERLK